jgi:uncharacterized surface protein with fasciclin (FAS1) repeats
MVGYEAMYPSRDIIDNTVNAEDYTILVAVGLVERLKSEGQFIVFAPVKDVFENLSAGMLEILLKLENKEK